jgi:hypothetical protein
MTIQPTRKPKATATIQPGDVRMRLHGFRNWPDLDARFAPAAVLDSMNGSICS